MVDLTEKMGDQVFKLGGKIISTTSELIKELMETLEKNKMDDPNMYTIAEHMKNDGKVITNRVPSDLVESMKRHMTEMEIAHVFLDIGDDDNCKLMIIRDVDRKSAEFATKLTLAEHGAIVEFTKDEFVLRTPKEEIACVTGLGAHEYELFRDMAKNNGLQFAATVGDDHKITILYDIDQQKEFDMTLHQTAWNLTGRNGDEYERIYKTKSQAQEIMKYAYKKKMQPMYIVDAQDQNRVFKLERDRIIAMFHYDPQATLEKNLENALELKIDDPEYIKKLNEIVVQMKTPVVVKENDFEIRGKVIKEKLPELDKDWVEKETPYREAFEAKAQEVRWTEKERILYEDDFCMSEFVEPEIAIGDDPLSPKEVKEIDSHARDAMKQVRTYQYYRPHDKQLKKLIDKAKKSLEQAKTAEDKEKTAQRHKEEKREAKAENKQPRDR